MIRQIRFLKGECGWVNFPDGAIKPGVLMVMRSSTDHLVKLKDLGMGLVPPRWEKDHSCAFVIMQQQVSEQGSAISVHRDTNTLLENTITNLNVHIVQEKVEHFRNFPGR